MNRHPSLESLARLALEPWAASPARQHLDAGCPGCEEVVRGMRQLAGDISQAGQLPAADLVERWGVLVSPVPANHSLFRLAELVEDKRELVGARSGSRGDRFLLFAADPYDVDLRVTRSRLPRSVDLRGQVLGPPQHLGSIEVQLLREDQVLAVTSADRAGAFHIPGVSAPPFSLRFLGPGLRLATPVIPS